MQGGEGGRGREEGRGWGGVRMGEGGGFVQGFKGADLTTSSSGEIASILKRHLY